jgi:hypothetical protein
MICDFTGSLWVALPNVNQSPILQTKGGGRCDFHKIEIKPFLKTDYGSSQCFRILVIHREMTPK